ESGGSRHNFGGPVGEHSPDFSGTDRFVHVFAAVGLARREISAWNHALCRLYTNINRILPRRQTRVHRRSSINFGAIAWPGSAGDFYSVIWPAFFANSYFRLFCTQGMSGLIRTSSRSAAIASSTFPIVW